MVSLKVINETLENFLNLVEAGKLIEAELMIKYFNDWNINLGNETTETKNKFMELFDRFGRSETKLSKNIQTQNFRYQVNGIAKKIIG